MCRSHGSPFTKNANPTAAGESVSPRMYQPNPALNTNIEELDRKLLTKKIRNGPKPTALSPRRSSIAPFSHGSSGAIDGHRPAGGRPPTAGNRPSARDAPGRRRMAAAEPAPPGAAARSSVTYRLGQWQAGDGRAKAAFRAGFPPTCRSGRCRTGIGPSSTAYHRCGR